ncbi:MAG: F0F1 ATP synthase subunit B [Oleibacter sp.]|nr:F0F1 ATP synthase subunit B [Thalassolituus sp.]
MLIDWFTVIAQVINFLVLVWLLKRYLYRPILNAIDTREKRIADELTDAAAKQAEAQQQHEEFLQKNSEFKQQHSARMEKLAEEVKTQRARLLETVTEESEALRQKWQVALKNEQLSVQQSLTQYVKDEVFAISRQVLNDLSDSQLEARMCAIFIQRLHALNEQETINLQASMHGSELPMIVRTAFELAEQNRHNVAAALNDIVGEEIEIQFITAAALVSGIEVNCHGQKIVWSIDNYLVSLKKGLNDILTEQTTVNTNTKTAENQAAEGQKVEGQKVEGQRVDGQRVDGQRVNDQGEKLVKTNQIKKDKIANDQINKEQNHDLSI